jgi:hypothetical protein
MPAKDRYHDVVKQALLKDGWTIEDEQVKLKIGQRRLWVDLQVGRASEGGSMLIEVKGLESNLSIVEALESTVGQYAVYQATLNAKRLDMPLVLAIPDSAYFGIFEEELGHAVRAFLDLKLVVFNSVSEEVLLWVS